MLVIHRRSSTKHDASRMHKIVPHCTSLYNTSFPNRNDDGQHSAFEDSNVSRRFGNSEERISCGNVSKTVTNVKSGDALVHSNLHPRPTRQESSDIPSRQTPWHHGGKNNERNTIDDDRTMREEVEFCLHMALMYALERHENVDAGVHKQDLHQMFTDILESSDGASGNDKKIMLQI